MADRIKFSISATPIEDISTQDSGSSLIAASECYGTVGGSGTVTINSFNSTGGVDHGYANGAIKYDEAPYNSWAKIDDGDNLEPADFLIVVHTGIEYSSADNLGTNSVTTDYLTIRSESGILAILKDGEAMCFPLRGQTNPDIFEIKCTTSDGSTNGSQGLDLAVKTLCAT